jgi:hypothetical protein
MSPTTSDRRWRKLIAAFVIIVVANAAMGYWLFSIQQQQTEDRRNGAEINCRNNQAQDDVLRAILRPSVESTDPVSPEEKVQLEHTYERVLGKTPGDKTVKEQRLELVEHLMAPLGGYTTNAKEQKALCEQRLKASGL